VQSAAALADRVRGRVPPDAPFYSVGTYDQSLDFYLGRTVTVVAFQDELEFGLRQQPELWLPTLDDFARAWRAAPAAGALMEPGTFDSLARAGLPMREIARDSRRVIVTRP
jgi:Aminoarabinose transferase C-terminal domain